MKKHTRAAILLPLLPLCLSMPSCALRQGDINQAVRSNNSRIESEISNAGKAPPVMVHKDGKWLAGHEVPMDLQNAPELRRYIRLASAIPVSLQGIAQRISQESKIPVTLESDLHDAGGMGGTLPIATGGTPPPGNPPTPVLTQNIKDMFLALPGGSKSTGNIDTGMASLSGLGNPSDRRITYTYEGELSELLNQIAAKFGVAWDYKGGRISFSRYLTKVFTLYLPAGTKETSAEVGGKVMTTDVSLGTISTGGMGGGMGSMSGGAGGNQQNNAGLDTKTKATIDPWKEIDESVKRLISAEGKFTVSPSSGDVTVTDTPVALKRVEGYIEQKNASLTRQIAIQVAVLTYDSTDSENFEINWNIVFQNSTWGMSLITPDLVTGATANMAMNILRPSSNFNGSSVVAKVLSTALHGTVATSTVATTLNNQPTPIQITNTSGYLKATGTSTTGLSSVVSNSLIPGSITTGFQMIVTPRIMERDKIILNYVIDLSRLLPFTTASSGSGDNKATIEIPNFNRQALIQAVCIKAGDTLVLAGFEQAEDNSNLNGPIFPENALFGSRNLNKKRTRLVILVTPVIIGNGAL